MNKKLLVSVFLCIFILSLCLAAEKKAKTIEFLDHNYIFSDDPALWELTPVPDPTVLTNFLSDPIISLLVPPSPKSEALFFEIWVQYFFAWSTFQDRRATAAVWLEVVSDDMPPEIEVYAAKSIIDISETNNAGNETLIRERSFLNFKRIVKRNSVGDNLFVVYKDTGDDVPVAEAIPIINKLIDNGFDIRIYTLGRVKGINWLKLVTLGIEATRLSKD